MKVMIFGNLASGKSYLANKILGDISKMEYLSIDDFRKKFGNGSMEREIVAKQKFLDCIQANELQLIEATGLGDTGEYIAKKLHQSEELKYIIILKTPLEVCLSRLKNRIWNVPYPAPPEQAFELAEISDKMIANNYIQKLWHCAINYIIFEIKSLDDIKIQQIINNIKIKINNETD